MMPITCEQLLAALADFRLIAGDAMREFQSVSTSEGSAAGAESLADDLVRRGSLTAYQASLLLDGRGKDLLFGDYLILDKLGQGGMGTVYMALHTRLHRVVAIKRLSHGRMAGPDATKRFTVEIEAIGRLDHPNLIRANHASQERGELYLVMEYAEGLDLLEVSRRCGPMRVGDACELARQVAVGLQHIHEHGLVHRDIKPSNLILTTQETVKILDLGLAVWRREESIDKRLTATGQALGTIDYMAPEQVEDSHGVDIRADIYSLGCTLCKLLVGHPPFTAKEYPEKLERLMARLYNPAPSISRYRGDLPDDLVVVVARMLSRDPADRFQEPGQVVGAIEAYRSDCDLQSVLALARGGREAVPLLGMAEHEGSPSAIAAARHPAGSLAQHKAADYRRLAVVTIGGLLLAVAALFAWRLRPLADRSRQVSDSSMAAKRDAENERRAGPDAMAANRETRPPANTRTPAEQQRYEAALAVIDQLTKGSPDVEAGRDVLLQAVAEIRRRDDVVALAKSLAARASGDPAYRETASQWLCDVADKLAPMWTPVSAEDRDAARMILTESIRLDPQSARAYSARATLHYGQGNLESTVADATAAIKINPRDAMAYYWRGSAYLQQGNLDQAIIDCTETIRLDPRCNAAYHNRGAAYQGKGELDKAIADFSEAIKILPTFQQHYQNRASLRLNKGEFDKAVADYTELIRMDPRNADYYDGRAKAHLRSSAFDSAIADFTEVLSIDPKRGGALNNRGVAYLRKGDYERAIADYTAAIGIDPKDSTAWSNRGEVHLRRLDYDQAIADYTEAIKIAPTDNMAWSNRGVACAKQGNLDLAIADWTEAIKLAPTDNAAWSNRGHAYAQQGNLDLAIADYTEVIRIDSKNATALQGRGEAYLRKLDFERAIADYTEAIKIAPTDRAAWSNRGYAHFKRGNLDLAIADWTEAVRIDPNNLTSLSNRGSAYKQKGDWDLAIADYTEVIRIDPQNANAFQKRGEAYVRKLDYERAIADYGVATRLDPKLVAPHLRRAEILAKLGQLERAREDVAAAMQADHGTPTTCNNLAWFLANSREPALRDPTQAVELATRAVELAPDIGNYWNTLGAAQYRAGDWQAALQSFEKSSEVGGGNSWNWFFLALAHRQLGHQEEARRWYDKGAKEMDENHSTDEGHLDIRAEAEKLLGVGASTPPPLPQDEP